MLVDTDLLLKYGGLKEKFAPSQTIFAEGDYPAFYYQVISGSVKLNHFDDEDRELIQSILYEGQSVCELLSLTDEKFPINAVAMTHAVIMKVPSDSFSDLLRENPQVAIAVQRFTAERLFHKFIWMQNNASKYSRVRICGILKYFKSLSIDQSPLSYKLPLTRQQLASIRGLRIETVIRTVKKMEREKLLAIKNGKIYF